MSFGLVERSTEEETKMRYLTMVGWQVIFGPNMEDRNEHRTVLINQLAMTDKDPLNAGQIAAFAIIQGQPWRLGMIQPGELRNVLKLQEQYLLQHQMSSS